MMITHYNVIANTIQLVTFEQSSRPCKTKGEVVLGMLPHSHIYGIVVIAALSLYRGDCIVSLPGYNPEQLLGCIQRYQINVLNLVPTIIQVIVKNPDIVAKFDLSSVRTIVSGGASLPENAGKLLAKNFPNWTLRPAYGATEVAACLSHTSVHDAWSGSAGSLLPGVEVKLIDQHGIELTGHNQPGELLVKSSSICIGYLGNDSANKETFLEDTTGRWMKTGDIVEVRKSKNGNEHLFVVDRVKDMIKVKVRRVATFVLCRADDFVQGKPSCSG